MMLGGFLVLGFCLVISAFIIMSVRIYQERPDFIKKVLKYFIIATIGLIFSVISLLISFRIDTRHTSSYSRSLKSVQKIWGGSIVQYPPNFYYQVNKSEEFENKKTGKIETRVRKISKNMGFETQDLKLNIKSNIRKKGLLTFPGYNLDFKGKYVIQNLLPKRENFHFYFALPANAGNITDISIILNGKPYKGDTNIADGISWAGILNRGEKKEFIIKYNAQGTENFTYSLAANKLEIKNLLAEISTDFKDYQVPDGAMVHTGLSSDDTISKMEWKSSNLVTGQNIALNFSIAGNYGKIVSKMFLYSPLAIFLFLGFLLIFGISKQLNLHPMHYIFIITAFFVLYLLGSYLISYVHVIGAILIALAISTALIVYYSYLIKKGKELVNGVIFGSILFQWIFSTAFFFPEHTGLMITLASIICGWVCVRFCVVFVACGLFPILFARLLYSFF